MRINENITNEQRRTLIEELENLRDQVPVLTKTLEVRNAINDTIIDLADANIDVLVNNVNKRTSALSASIGGLNEVTEHTNKIAKILTLEGATRLVNMAKDGLGKIESIKNALDENDPQKVADSIQSALDFFNSVKAEAEAKMAELENS